MIFKRRKNKITIAADLKQISSAHLKITKNFKVQWQYLKSLQNCILSLNFHADILNCGDIAEKGGFKGHIMEDWKRKSFADSSRTWKIRSHGAVLMMMMMRLIIFCLAN